MSRDEEPRPTRVQVEAKIPIDPFKLKGFCPKCDEVFSISVKPPKSRYDFECRDCDFDAEAAVFVVRSRDSVKRHHPKTGNLICREFDLRLYDLKAREHHFEYELKTETQLEMQSNDLIVLFFNGGDEEDPIGFCNTTIRANEQVQVYRLRKGGCAILLAIGLLLASAGATLAAW